MVLWPSPEPSQLLGHRLNSSASSREQRSTLYSLAEAASSSCGLRLMLVSLAGPAINSSELHMVRGHCPKTAASTCSLLLMQACLMAGADASSCEVGLVRACLAEQWQLPCTLLALFCSASSIDLPTC